MEDHRPIQGRCGVCQRRVWVTTDGSTDRQQPQPLRDFPHLEGRQRPLSHETTFNPAETNSHGGMPIGTSNPMSQLKEDEWPADGEPTTKERQFKGSKKPEESPTPRRPASPTTGERATPPDHTAGVRDDRSTP